MIKFCASNFAIIFILCLSGNSRAQSILQEIDSLWNTFQQETDQNRKIDLINEISYTYRRIQPDSVLKYADKALRLSKTSHYKKGMAEAFKNKGIAYYKLGMAGDTIIHYYQRSIQLAELINDYYTQAACYNNIALVRIYNLAYNEAIQSLLKALTFYEDERIKEDRLKALILGNLGSVYHAQNDFDRAISYFEEALTVGKNLKIPAITAIFADEVANVKLKTGKIEEAYEEVLGTLKLINAMDDLESKSSILITLANIECQLNKYDQAKKHAVEALKIAEDQSFTRKKIQSLAVLSKTDEANGEYDQAISFSKQALDISRQTEMFLYEARALLQLSDLFDKKNDQQTALYYLRQYNEVHERNRDRENREMASRMEADYQAQTKQSQIELLQKEQAV
ncbi:MAG: tetratricopeptide repeat protein, partial [Lewinella sp.]|nr:tetratricopeptide repeat protein [Lewinella sp.]